MKIFTIGFTKSSAESFFGRLTKANIKRLLDIRLYNASQLAGFAKKEDLAFFLREICKIPYEHISELAPTAEMLEPFRKKKGNWNTYEKQFLELIKTRQIEKTVPKEKLNGACLLCSEDTPERCHRRLVAEYLKEKWKDVEIQHL